jgi:CBS domain containing-hemolysin-like protein
MTSDNPEPGSKKTISSLISALKNALKRTKDNTFTPDYEKLDVSKQDMIKGVFDLSNKIVRDIMIPRVDIVAAELKTPLKTIIKMLFDTGYSRLPVYDDTIDNIAGIIYTRDLLKLLIDKQTKFQIKKFLHAPYFVPQTMSLDELLIEFKIRKLHLAIVVDEYGGVDGIVTLEDVLEQIVGDIKDEFDSERLPELEKIKAHIYEVDSRMPLADFNSELALELPANDFDTIGGYVLDLFGKIPAKNEEIEENGIFYKIKDINGTIINRIIVTLPAQS